MTAQDKPDRTTGVKPWLKLLLVGSLALNLAVIGLGAGLYFRFSGGDKQWRRPPDIGVMIFRDLDRDTRKALRQEAGGGHGSYVDRRHAEAAAVITALRAEPFDPAQLLAELKAQSQARDAFHGKVREAWVMQLTGLSPQQRAGFADKMEERLSRSGPKRH